MSMSALGDRPAVQHPASVYSPNAEESRKRCVPSVSAPCSSPSRGTMRPWNPRRGADSTEDHSLLDRRSER
jgi:hypothetical protein